MQRIPCCLFTLSRKLVYINWPTGYFHIHIFPHHRKYLRFAYKSVIYQYLTIPFRLSLAPRVFTKCVEVALTPLRTMGIRIFAYVEDYLLCLLSWEQAVRDNTTVVDHLSKLGFRIYLDKSCLSPSKCRVSRSPPRHSLILGQFIGKACCHILVLSVVQMGLLLMRHFQRWISSESSCPCRHLNRKDTSLDTSRLSCGFLFLESSISIKCGHTHGKGGNDSHFQVGVQSKRKGL